MRKLISMGLVLLMILFILPIAGFTEERKPEEGNGEIVILDNLSDMPIMEEEYSSDPFVPENVDKAIFGSDGRVTVTNSRVFPFMPIAYMVVKATCGDTWTGTGFMVGRDRMLTAAHCLVCSTHGKWANQITFYFGFKNYKNYAYCYSGRWKAWAGNTFSDRSYSTQNDYGCIKFYENVGDVTGNLGVRFGVTDKDIESNYYYVAGYRDGVLKYDYGKIKAYDDDHFSFTLDTLAGNSGGPIFDNNNYAVGIIIANDSQRNFGFRLNSKVNRDLMALD